MTGVGLSIAFDPWAEAQRLGITVVERPLVRGRRGEYWHHERRIHLAEGLNYRQARATLTHELMHALAGDVPSPFGLISDRQELLARRRTAVALVDPVEYSEAERLRDGHVPGIAHDLDVTTRVVEDWRALVRAIHGPLPLMAHGEFGPVTGGTERHGDRMRTRGNPLI